MQQQPAATERTERRSLQRSVRLHGRWLLLARGSWITSVVLTLAIFFGSLPVYVAQLHTRCAGTACVYQQLTAGQVQTLQGLGWSLDDYAALQVVLMLITVVVSVGVSTLIVWRRPDDWMALLVALSLVTGAPMIATTSVITTFSSWLVPGYGLFFLSFFLGLLVFLLFPSGRFAPRFMRWSLVVFPGMDAIVGLFFLQTSVIPGNAVSRLPWLVAAGQMATVALGQVYRYRRVSTPLERQQTKWVVYGYAVPITVNVIGTLLALVPVFAARSSLALFAVNEMGFLLALFPPLAFGVAILRYRLWDIDLVINRTLVYGTLAVSVIGLYILVVVGLGSLIQLSGNLLLSLLATGLIAVLFQPAHARLQQSVNHVLYGERDEPARVLTRLGHRLEATLTPEEVLPAIVETVAQALKLPAAAITWTPGEGGAEPHLGAIYGKLHAQTAQTAVSLVYQQEKVGTLVLALRKPGESLTPADQRFLRHLAPQIGLAVHAVRLTADLKQLTDDLQRSRTQLVTAREEERRRLRRDLHDGLGSVLASLNWRAGALRPLLHRDPVAAEALVVEQQHTIQAAIGDIRRLVYDLRPPALDELGLLGALREQAAKLSTGPERDRAADLLVEVSVPETLPTLSAAVEVAAYRIAQEALTNVAQHAQAHHCTLWLACTADHMEVIVADDGIGLPTEHPVGVGLLSMRERAEELGGRCEVQRVPEGGTRVHAVLPLPRDED
jgi:signal transduction histidine kinase